MELNTDIALDAPASAAWQVLGRNFGTIGEWSATLAKSSLDGPVAVGAVRTCQGLGLGPFPPGKITEKLTIFSPEQLAFTYVATTGTPWFITHAQNAWSIEAIDEKHCIVHSRATIELVFWLRPLGLIFPYMMARAAAEFTEELKHRIETGTPHPRKIATLTQAVL